MCELRGSFPQTFNKKSKLIWCVTWKAHFLKLSMRSVSECGVWAGTHISLGLQCHWQWQEKPIWCVSREAYYVKLSIVKVSQSDVRGGWTCSLASHCCNHALDNTPECVLCTCSALLSWNGICETWIWGRGLSKKIYRPICNILYVFAAVYNEYATFSMFLLLFTMNMKCMLHIHGK